jgi:hypothetical protein
MITMSDADLMETLRAHETCLTLLRITEERLLTIMRARQGESPQPAVPIDAPKRQRFLLSASG